MHFEVLQVRIHHHGDMHKEIKKDHTTKITGIILTTLLILLVPTSTFANGTSFYARVAIAENDTLRFEIPNRKYLPDSQKKILSCRSNVNKPCVYEALDLLEKEFRFENNSNLKAWKLFLIGTLYFEKKDFKNALNSYDRVLKYVSDPAFKAATLHRIISIHIILRDTDSSLGTIEIIQNLFPNYNNYDRIFSTYPDSLCDPAWNLCTFLPSIKTIVNWRPILQKIKTTKNKLTLLSATKSQNISEYAQTSIELGKLYEKICPLQTIFHTVCPDALEIYKEIYSQFSRIKGLDYAFLKIQQSQFAYEYEGDEIAKSKDIIKYYGPFLEKFPNSLLSVDILKEYNKAKKILEKHSK